MKPATYTTVDGAPAGKISCLPALYAAAGERRQKCWSSPIITGMGTAEKNQKVLEELWRTDVAGHPS